MKTILLNPYSQVPTKDFFKFFNMFLVKVGKMLDNKIYTILNFDAFVNNLINV